MAKKIVVEEAKSTKRIAFGAPNLEVAEFDIKGTSPLVVHRFDLKSIAPPGPGPKPKPGRKNVPTKTYEEMYESAKYKSREGWEGFNASAVRKAMISACRLVNFKMVLAKLSIFAIQDGWDAKEPQMPLIRIYGESVMQLDRVRLKNGSTMIASRPAYHDWSAKIKIRWDADQFSVSDVYNLLYRVGLQVGLCEGRWDSKDSAGMGWGCFEILKGAQHERTAA